MTATVAKPIPDDPGLAQDSKVSAEKGHSKAEAVGKVRNCRVPT